MLCAFRRAFEKAGIKRDARIPIIAITTSSSMSVNPEREAILMQSLVLINVERVTAFVGSPEVAEPVELVARG
jgi:hypothetical protein